MASRSRSKRRRAAGPTQERRARRRMPAGQTVRVIGSVARPAAGAARAATRTAGGVAQRRGQSCSAALPSALRKLARRREQADARRTTTRLRSTPEPRRRKPRSTRRVHREQEQKSARRQKYLRDFSREVPDEMQRDADIERDRQRPRANAGGIGRPARGRRRRWGGSPARRDGGQGGASSFDGAPIADQAPRPARVSRRRRAA